MTGSEKQYLYAVRTSLGMLTVGNVTFTPEASKEIFKSNRVVDSIREIALRTTFAADRLTPAFKWSQTAKVHTSLII